MDSKDHLLRSSGSLPSLPSVVLRSVIGWTSLGWGNKFESCEPQAPELAIVSPIRKMSKYDARFSRLEML